MKLGSHSFWDGGSKLLTSFSNAAFGVQRSGWTKDTDAFLSWLSGISFSGGGFSEASTCEGLAEALTVLTC